MKWVGCRKAFQEERNTGLKKKCLCVLKLKVTNHNEVIFIVKTYIPQGEMMQQNSTLTKWQLQEM